MGREPDEDEIEEVEPGAVDDDGEELAVEVDADRQLSALPEVRLRHDRVPEPFEPSRFFKVMIETVLTNTPVSYHQEARRRRGKPFDDDVSSASP